MIASAQAQTTDPTARYPIRPGLFCLDANSPEVLAGAVKPGDILARKFPPPPLVVIPAAQHLLGAGDVLDGLALVAPAPNFNTTFALLFGVDRASPGGAPPDTSLVAAGFPFNVLDQAAKHQQAGDLFMVTTLFNRLGPAAPRPGARFGAGGAANIPDNNILVINQGDAGGVDYAVTPVSQSPGDPYDPNLPESQVDETMGSAPSAAAIAFAPQPLFYFSLKKGSPALNTLPHDINEPCPSGADIYVDNDPNHAGLEALYVSHRQLGLGCNDDIDGIVVFDQQGDSVFTPGVDQVLFTLARNAPSGNGPAHIYSSFGNGGFTLWALNNQLGLGNNDNVTQLDIVLANDIDLAIKEWGIGNCRCIGDVDCDGDIDLSDLALILSKYGHCAPDPVYVEHADYDSSGCIDLPDLALVLAHYGTLCPAQ